MTSEAAMTNLTPVEIKLQKPIPLSYINLAFLKFILNVLWSAKRAELDRQYMF